MHCLYIGHTRTSYKMISKILQCGAYIKGLLFKKAPNKIHIKTKKLHNFNFSLEFIFKHVALLWSLIHNIPEI